MHGCMVNVISVILQSVTGGTRVEGDTGWGVCLTYLWRVPPGGGGVEGGWRVVGVL